MLEHRYKIATISYELFMELFNKKASDFVQGDRVYFWHSDLPKGTQIVAVSALASFSTDVIELKLWNSEWPIVPPGHAIPPIDVQFTRMYIKIDKADLEEFKKQRPEFWETDENTAAAQLGLVPDAVIYAKWEPESVSSVLVKLPSGTVRGSYCKEKGQVFVASNCVVGIDSWEISGLLGEQIEILGLPLGVDEGQTLLVTEIRLDIGEKQDIIACLTVRPMTDQIEMVAAHGLGLCGERGDPVFVVTFKCGCCFKRTELTPKFVAFNKCDVMLGKCVMDDEALKEAWEHRHSTNFTSKIGLRMYWEKLG